MLARTFKSAAELDIPEHEYNALVTVLYMAEDGKIKEENIYMPSFHCGTTHCLAGWANVIDEKAFPESRTGGGLSRRLPPPLRNLFGLNDGIMRSASGATAVKALRTYLETGKCA